LREKERRERERKRDGLGVGSSGFSCFALARLVLGTAGRGDRKTRRKERERMS